VFGFFLCWSPYSVIIRTTLPAPLGYPAIPIREASIYGRL
jgi:hypothetical protein